MEKINTLQELCRFFVLHQKIVCFGAGNIGRLILSFARKSGNIEKIENFLVSEKGDEDTIVGVKVTDIKEWRSERAIVLVTTTEQFHEEIENTLNQSGHTGIRKYLSDELISMIRYFEKTAVPSINFATMMRQRVDDVLDKVMPRQQLAFSVHLCEHCNLNCAGCNNFSPLAKEQFTDIDSFESDFKRLSKLSGGDAYRIQLAGGEPLLNPVAIEYAVIARNYFPYARISFITNGLLLKKQREDFFDNCKKYRIDIDMTPYPINLDYEELGSFLEKRGIGWKYQNGSMVKKMRKEVFLLNPDTPKSPATHNFLNCYMANECVLLSEGKMMCTKIACAHHFIDYFKDECAHMYVSPREWRCQKAKNFVYGIRFININIIPW